jgi:hypothetical protein
MSDDQPEGFMIPLFGGRPASKEEVEQKQAEAHALYSDFAEILTTVLNEEQLITLRRVWVAGVNDTSMGTQIAGIMSGISHLRFGNCIGCGQDHFNTKEIANERPASDYPE